MDTKQQIRKYKIQLHELRTALNMAIEREKHIYDAEQDRIAFKTQEFKDECAEKSAVISRAQMSAIEKISEYNTELEKITAELDSLKCHKFQFRMEVLNKIHAENRAKKDIRRNREVFNKQLADIQEQITSHSAFIKKYDTLRRQINEDYYNWRAERDDTTTRMSSLSNGDKKREILQNYLTELENDDRAHPETRYTKLDQDVSHTRREIEHLGYQYTKLENYMRTFTETIPSQQEMAISTYLRDTGARIPILNSKQRELQTLIDNTKTEINNFDTQMGALANTPLPSELVEQTARANQRLEISGQRAHSEYDPLILALTEKISNLEQQLVIELGLQNNLPSTSTNLIGADIQDTRTDTTPNTSLPMSDTGLSALQALPTVIDFTGKSRKEIERLKKQQLVTAMAGNT